MSEAMLKGHLSTTSLSVVWTTKEVEDKNNNIQHQYSRSRQFFTTSFSVLSPFLTPSSPQLYLWSGGNSLEDCLRELEGKEIVFRAEDGSEFRVFYAKDGQKKGSTSSRGHFVDKVIKRLVKCYTGSDADDFAIELIADMDVELLKGTKFFRRKAKQYKKEINVNFEDTQYLAQAFAKSRFDHPNLVIPHVFVLDDHEIQDKNGIKRRSLRGITPREGVGSLEEVVNLLSGKPPELREVILCQFIKGALKGLKHIHSKGFVYGNFDPSNIIVCEDQKSLTGLTGKLTGFSKCWQAGLRCPRFGCHLAPECRQSSEHIFYPSMDLWELGSCLFFLFTRQPYRDSSIVKNPFVAMKIVGQGLSEWSKEDNKRLKNANLAPWLESLIKNLLAASPQERPNISEVLNSPWMLECECLISQNQEYVEEEISEIIKMLKNRVPRDSSISRDRNEESSVNEFENLETQLSNETSYQPSGTQNSVVGSSTSEEAETSSGEINNSNNFYRLELSTVATTSDDMSVKKIRALESASSISPKITNKFDSMNNIVRDIDSVPVCSSNTLEHHGAVSCLSTAASSLSTPKINGRLEAKGQDRGNTRVH